MIRQDSLDSLEPYIPAELRPRVVPKLDTTPPMSPFVSWEEIKETALSILGVSEATWQARYATTETETDEWEPLYLSQERSASKEPFDPLFASRGKQTKESPDGKLNKESKEWYKEGKDGW